VCSRTERTKALAFEMTSAALGVLVISTRKPPPPAPHSDWPNTNGLIEKHKEEIPKKVL
jgi:hypothetical protein